MSDASRPTRPAEEQPLENLDPPAQAPGEDAVKGGAVDVFVRVIPLGGEPSASTASRK